MTLQLAAGDLRTADFDYELPRELIAQAPTEPRDAARLLVLDRATARISHRVVRELDQLLRAGDLLVANRTRVLPARLIGRKRVGGGRVELLLLKEHAHGRWEAFVRPGRRLKPGTEVEVLAADGALRVQVGEMLPGGRRLVQLDEASPSRVGPFTLGVLPLPPYIKGWQGDPERYQTVYGDVLGSVAAPTAGLHFTPGLLTRLQRMGVGLELVTLHVGPDTFRPIRAERVLEHDMHAEWASVPAQTLASISATRSRGGRVVAVGTTTVRAIESVAGLDESGGWSGWTRLFIMPGYEFRRVDALLTNFHLPRSTLLLLVSAFAGRDRISAAYDEAVRRRYCFYSFGDAMLIW